MRRLFLLLLAMVALAAAPFGQQAMAAGHCMGEMGDHHAMGQTHGKAVAAAESCCPAVVAALPDRYSPASVPTSGPAIRPGRHVTQLAGIEPVGQDPPPRG